MDTVICKEVVITTLTRRGKGTEYSPIRVITQVFEKNGDLIAENDPYDEYYTDMDLVHFARWCVDNENTLSISPSDITKWRNSIKIKK